MNTLTALSSLVRRNGVPPRLLAIFAHPDDEVLAVGGRLERLSESRFLCVTDGVPRDGRDAQAHGFASLEEYRVARREELNAAFASAGLDGVACAISVALDNGPATYIADQTAALHLTTLSRRLALAIEEFQPEAVLTHPYEGGHPDHDACAFAAQAAVRLSGKEVPLLEAAFYHAAAEGIATGVFLPGEPSGSMDDELSPQEQAHKRERLACFASQRETLGLFGTEVERYRLAPSYNFTRPPHSGLLYYEGFPWGMSGARFCELARSALLELGL